jgi:hypothetical protein
MLHPLFLKAAGRSMALTNPRCDGLVRQRSENVWESPISSTKLSILSSQNAKLRPNSNRKLSSSDAAKRWWHDGSPIRVGQRGVMPCRSFNRRSSLFKSRYCSCISVTLPASLNTRMIARCERERALHRVRDRVVDCVGSCIPNWAVSQPIADQIKAVPVLAGTDLVNVLGRGGGHLHPAVCVPKSLSDTALSKPNAVLFGTHTFHIFQSCEDQKKKHLRYFSGCGSPARDQIEAASIPSSSCGSISALFIFAIQDTKGELR